MYQSSNLDLPPLNSAQVERLAQSRTTLWLIMAVAVVLRVAAAFYHGNTVEVLPGIHDQVSYHALAQRVIDGFGFSFAEMHWPITRPGEPTAHWSFLYTLYLAAVYLICGVTPLAARLLQALIAGLLHPWLAYRLGRRIFGPTTGLWAAAITAGYLYFIYYAGALMTETFYIVGILWCLDLALAIGQSGTGGAARDWLLLGLALGVTLLLRQVFMLFVPFLLLWLLWQIKPGKAQAWGRTIKNMALCGLVAACLILPWTVRNYVAFGKFVPLNTNSGYAFFWGNHPIYGTKFPGVLPDDGPTYQELIPGELWALNEAELDSALLRLGIGFVREDAQRYLLLSVSRLREYFKFWPSSESTLVSNIARVGSFGLLLPLLLWGIALCVRRIYFCPAPPLAPFAAAPTREPRSDSPPSKGGPGKGWRLDSVDPSINRSGLLLIVLFAAVYTGVHLLTWTLVRYRLPVDSVFVLFAAYTLASLAKVGKT